MITSLVRTCAVLPMCAATVAVYFRMKRSSRTAASLFAIGFGLRAGIGIVLFAISAFQLPLFEEQQTGDGFWTLAVDARSYFGQAAVAASHGISTIANATESPVYTRVLAMWLIGVTPIAAVLFNLVCNVLLAVVIVLASRRHRLGVVALGFASVSPALIIFGTQPLKDPFCILPIALAIYAVRIGRKGSTRPIFPSSVVWRAPHCCSRVFLPFQEFALTSASL